ncbi:ABC transporter ATP-binding protein [Acuticoccus mangrovi]|uniref:ABC transporter ATP-binding protein n=1 Tax=Acuticoccus mangrovi TaxID=2796142 RepID=A0A934ILC1_9HYPH|nr:ABC transporter ATP-binding protein [Acuticoccus mangrovi]MBJ3774740.1 ABC transporter ATP-binding protein [Acuticoccus mangrovi]
MDDTDIILSVDGVAKTYADGPKALDSVSLSIRRGEILALLGPNGAGKTTLISIICGLVSPSAGSVIVDGHDIVSDYRAARAAIGLVPQEVQLEPFEKVLDAARFSRGLFGKARDDAYLQRMLTALSLWDKRRSEVKALSGGMKRRVLIAKALAHEPRILFLDEPTAGVDVELRKDMWAVVEELRSNGVTIILTTHYIEEAEAIADRVGIISGGRLVLVEEKGSLMRRLGRRELVLTLGDGEDLPPALARHGLSRSADGTFVYTFTEEGSLAALLADLAAAGVTVRDLETRRRSLEDIFVELVKNGADA